MSFKIEEVVFPTAGHALAAKDALTLRLEEIGSGLYARVFELPDSDMVLKVSREDDKGYIAYLRVLNELEFDSPYVPKIEKVLVYGNMLFGSMFEPMFYLTYMEKLVPCKKTRYDGEEVCSYLSNSQDPSMKRWVDRFSRMADHSFEFGTKYKLNPRHHDLIALITLAKETSKKHCTFDLHYGNVMRRGRQIVLTDPLC